MSASIDEPKFTMGADSYGWPGLAKLAEECGELVQVIGKIIATNGGSLHWDGSDLRVRLTEEIADVLAAAIFVKTHNQLKVEDRVAEKLGLYHQWRENKQ